MQVYERKLEPHVAKQAARFIEAAGLGHVGPAVPQVDRETLAKWGVVFEQENLAAGGKRNCI